MDIAGIQDAVAEVVTGYGAVKGIIGISNVLDWVGSTHCTFAFPVFLCYNKSVGRDE